MSSPFPSSLTPYRVHSGNHIPSTSTAAFSSSPIGLASFSWLADDDIDPFQIPIPSTGNRFKRKWTFEGIAAPNGVQSTDAKRPRIQSSLSQEVFLPYETSDVAMPPSSSPSSPSRVPSSQIPSGTAEWDQTGGQQPNITMATQSSPAIPLAQRVPELDNKLQSPGGRQRKRSKGDETISITQTSPRGYQEQLQLYPPSSRPLFSPVRTSTQNKTEFSQEFGPVIAESDDDQRETTVESIEEEHEQVQKDSSATQVVSESSLSQPSSSWERQQQQQRQQEATKSDIDSSTINNDVQPEEEELEVRSDTSEELELNVPAKNQLSFRAQSRSVQPAFEEKEEINKHEDVIVVHSENEKSSSSSLSSTLESREVISSSFPKASNDDVNVSNSSSDRSRIVATSSFSMKSTAPQGDINENNAIIMSSAPVTGENKHESPKKNLVTTDTTEVTICVTAEPKEKFDDVTNTDKEQEANEKQGNKVGESVAENINEPAATSEKTASIPVDLPQLEPLEERIAGSHNEPVSLPENVTSEEVSTVEGKDKERSSLSTSLENALHDLDNLSVEHLHNHILKEGWSQTQKDYPFEHILAGIFDGAMH